MRIVISLIESIFFFKQKTAYDVRISDWSSDVCSSDLCLTEPGCDFLGVHASVAQCRKGADAVGGVHVLALEVLRERQFDGLFLGADLDGEGVAVLDPLALRQFLEAPIAPPS